MRLWPPARSISSRSSSKLRPSVLPAPAVFSSSSRQRSDSPSACSSISPTRGERLVVRLADRGAGVEHHAVGLDLVAHAQRVDQRGGRLAPHLAVLGGRVDQVDGVDRDRLDRPRLHQLEELRDVVVAPARGAPLARRLVEDLDRRTAALDAALVRLHQTACRGNMSADEHQGEIRAQSDRRAAHRRRQDGTVQLASGPRSGRPDGAAHRGHRPRALHAGERRPDPGGAALARARLGRGAAVAVGAARAPRRGGRPAARLRPRLRGRGRGALPGPRRGRDHLPGRDPGPGHQPARGDPGLRDPPLGRQPALQPGGGGGRPRHGHHARGARPGPRVEHAAPADAAARRWASSRRSTRTSRCCTARTARSSPSATARPRCRSCATPATCPRRCATTPRCSAGATTRAPRS